MGCKSFVANMGKGYLFYNTTLLLATVRDIFDCGNIQNLCVNFNLVHGIVYLYHMNMVFPNSINVQIIF